MPARRVLATIVSSLLLVWLGQSTSSATDDPPSTDQAAACGNAPLNQNAPADDAVTPGAYFSFPTGTTSQRMAIRDRVLDTIRSTNGSYCAVVDTSTPEGSSTPVDVFALKHGVIKIASWSWNDQGITDALIAAMKRGVSVQVVAARSINVTSRYAPWVGKNGMRRNLRYYSGAVPADQETNDDEAGKPVSWVHDCSGACRGSRGTAHAKYFLFDDVRSAGDEHLPTIVVQTSMNLTRFAYEGQWNQAKVSYDAESYGDFVRTFYEAASEDKAGYAEYDHSDTGVNNLFFPKGSADADPAYEFLNPDPVDCTGGTKVRVINYAFYGPRGVSLANRLKALQSKGCDVRVIYSLTSRKTLKALRSRSGRGPIPVKQCVVRNKRGKIVKYNHSKWVAVGDRVMAGSGNWSAASFNDDEQFQQFTGSAAFLSAFDYTWNQKNTKAPRGARLGDEVQDAPRTLRWGHGDLQYLTPEG